MKTRVNKSQGKIIVLAFFAEVQCGVGVKQIKFKMGK